MKRGFTMIELVLYMGLLVILLPSLVLMLLQVNKSQQHVYMRTEIEHTSALLFAELSDEIQHAQAIVVSSSTLDTDQSVLTYRNRDGQTISIGYTNDMVDFGGTSYNIGRVQLSDTSNHWLTSENIAVTQFRFEPVRNSEGTLTALNFELELAPLTTATTVDQANILTTQTSFEITSACTEE